MPDFTGSASAIRANGYSIRCFASFYAGALVAQSTVAAVAGSPVKALVVSAFSPTYDYADILPGYRVDVYASNGTTFKGRTRIRFGNQITDTVIHIRETSAAAIDFAVGDVVRIYDDLRLSDKLTEANELFLPDGTGYTDQGSNPPPLACSGGHYAGRVDDGQTFATIQMTGSNSDVVDPDSTPGNVLHLWTLPSGVAFQSGSADSDADPVIEADVGQHLILHTVTDADNSKTVTQAVVVMVTSDAAPPHKVVVTNLQGAPDSGFNWECEVVSGAVDTDTIPDGCLCILWARERINGAWQSIRNNSTDREHILAVGYVRRERVRRAADGVNHLSFECVSPLTRLREIAAYSKVMEESASPDRWLKVKTLGVKRAYIQLIQFYTTLVESGFDLLVDGDFFDYRYPAFYLQRNTVYGMLEELANGQDARTTCDRTGQFLLATEPPFIPYSDRSSATTVWALAAQDILDLEINIDHYPTVELYKTSGFTGGASGNEPVFSLYPGKAPGIGITTPTRDRLIVSDQDDLNERTGRYGALADRKLVDSNGQRIPAAEITLTLRGSYNFFDFRNEYVTLTDDVGRRMFSGARFYPTSVNVDFAGNGAAQTRVTLMQETNAPAGDTFIPPEQAIPPYTPIITTPPIYAPPGSTGRIPSYLGDTLPTKLWIADSGAASTHIATSWSPSLSSLSYTDISTGLSGSCIDGCADPYDYRRRFLVTTAGLYRCDNIWGGSPSWSLVASNATMFGDAARIGLQIGMSINRKGYIAICTGTNTFVYTTDYGSTWNKVSVNGAANNYNTSIPSPGSNGRMSFAISCHNNGSTGWIYAFVYVSGGNGTVYKSADWGATWSVVAAAVYFFFQAVSPIVPYKRGGGALNINDGSQVIYFTGGSGHSLNSGGLYKSSNAGVTWGSVYTLTTTAVFVPGTAATGRAIQTFTHDGNIVLVATVKTGSGSTPPTNDESGMDIFDLATSSSPAYNSGGMFTVGGNAQYTGINGFALHSQAALLFSRGKATIRWTVDAGATTPKSAAAPGGYSGVAVCEWDLSDFIAPA